MANDILYTAIDLGTSKIATVIGRIGHSGYLKVVGMGSVPSQGIRQGMVEDPQQASNAIKESVDEARRYLGRRHPTWAYTCVTGEHITSLNTEAELNGSKDNGNITPRDIHHLIQSSYPEVSDGAEVLHVIPMEYEVDGFKGVRNPLGLHADRLKVESHIVLSEKEPSRDVLHLIKNSKLVPRSLVAQSLAAGEAVLTEDERELGVVLMDMGAGTVDLTIYRSGNPWYSAVIPVGGSHMTNDLAAALGVPFYYAEELKLKWGNAYHDTASANREIMLPGRQGEPTRTVSQEELCLPLRDRLEEMVRLGLLRVKQAGLRELPPAGLVITGGCAEMPGFESMVRLIADAPVRVAPPHNLPGLPSALLKPSYAATVGTLLWGIKHQGRQRPYANGHRSLLGHLVPWRKNHRNGYVSMEPTPLAKRREI